MSDEQVPVPTGTDDPASIPAPQAEVDELHNQGTPDTSDALPTEPSATVIKDLVEELVDETRLFFQSTGVEDLISVLEKRNVILGVDEFRARVDSPGTYEHILAQSINDYSGEGYRILKAIEAIDDKTLFENTLLRNGQVILKSLLTPRRASGNGAMLTGKEARIEFAIKGGQVKRVPLLNSGFSLDLEGAPLADLNIFFNRAHDETNAYGREFGASFFYFNDLLIKNAIVELIIPLIIGSSLKSWQKNDALLRSIKLYDLKSILTALAVLMYPNGFNFTHVCHNPSGECDHVEEKLIDITKLFRHNFALLPDENIDLIAGQSDVSSDRVARYQDALGFTKSLRYGSVGFELQVPSLLDYLDYGKKFNAELIKSNFTDTNINPAAALIFSFYKVYTPFIKTVALYLEDGSVDVITNDQETIAYELGLLQKTDTDQTFIKDMDAFISSTEVTHICYPASACPKCGYTPTGNYYAVDPENTFFTLSLKRLTIS